MPKFALKMEVITSVLLKDLLSLINNALAQGWSLQGSMIKSADMFYQPMTKLIAVSPASESGFHDPLSDQPPVSPVPESQG